MTTMPRFTATEVKNDTDINFSALFGILVDYKWQLLSIIGIFTFLGIAYAMLATPMYASNAMLQIEEKKGVTRLTDQTSGMPPPLPEAVTEIELLKSRLVIGNAVKNLHLDVVVTPKYFPIFGGYVARHFKAESEDEVASPVLGLNSFAWGGEDVEVAELRVPDSAQDKPMTLKVEENQSFTVFDANNQILLHGTVNQPVEQDGYFIQVSKLQARPGTEFTVMKKRLSRTIQEYQGRISAGERGKQSGILSVALQDSDPLRAQRIVQEVIDLYVAQNIDRNAAESTQSLEFLRSQIPSVKKELEDAQRALNEYQTNRRSVDIDSETKGVLDQIVSLDGQISELNLKRVEMSRKFTTQHPAFQAVLGQLRQLEVEKDKLEKRVGNLPSTQQELLRLKRDVDVTSQTYTLMMNKVQELDVIRAGTVGSVRIIDNANANIDDPASPNKPLIVVAALVLGCLLGLAVIYTRHTLKRGIETPEAIEQLGLPVYASIPYSRNQSESEKLFGRGSRKIGESALLSIAHPTDLSTEALRSLRTSLHFAMIEAKNNILMISGPSPDVGKSFVSSNLAAVIAESGQRVLLIDGDMRKGYMHKIFNVKQKDGLSDLLSNRIAINDAIKKTEVDMLDFMSCGQFPPNPSELLMSHRFTTVLKQLGDLYDIVIIDTPPILAVTEAAIIGAHVGTSLIVARFGMNSAKELEATKRRFDLNGVPLKGVILNAVERKASNYSSYGNYQYAYERPSKS
ncbi:polysaccharide biosynthesis tyrosine autokinase [Pseudomonas sp. WAC2]|uniref:polysaccharide biosynthesis tyrosine autokinase n=1 Tax=Pseudomonas sp. WAC2 TaxID=3055057 RepID=UPI0025B0F1BB|nr:polysaccharide biosynthesis tyrosine autokinase [Pseudomonas sp. WAC2]MDN3236945.1 polysaccharide biosynthesis tyrosine autokinase [Pseudomonas sp. WAC2]